MTTTDRIERKGLIRAPRSRVWRALTNPTEFGEWFGAKLEGGFRPGQKTKGKITHPGYEDLTMDMTVDRMETEALFSYRWHPYAIDPKRDYSAETPTLVEFRLEEAKEGTWLTVVESGFDEIPTGRRVEAFRMNDKGWAEQLKNIERYVDLVKQ